jgi:2-polyprenyl-3-methyl-5-hydroxy-6-metoxy-1,4-benzoquinol methylase
MEVEQAHLDRYNFISRVVNGKTVLDIACGSGYGSYILAEQGNAKSVLGIDLDKNSIDYAEIRYPHSKINRLTADATKINIDQKFDIICCFETIEHLIKYELLLTNFNKLLSDDGILFISTPIAKETTLRPKNPYHVIEWSFKDFQNLVGQIFTIEEIYVQNIKRKRNYLHNRIFNFIKRKFAFEVNDLKLQLKNKYKSIFIYDDLYLMDEIESGFQILKLTKQ